MRTFSSFGAVFVAVAVSGVVALAGSPAYADADIGLGHGGGKGATACEQTKKYHKQGKWGIREYCETPDGTPDKGGKDAMILVETRVGAVRTSDIGMYFSAYREEVRIYNWTSQEARIVYWISVDGDEKEKGEIDVTKPKPSNAKLKWCDEWNIDKKHNFGCELRKERTDIKEGTRVDISMCVFPKGKVLCGRAYGHA